MLECYISIFPLINHLLNHIDVLLGSNFISDQELITCQYLNQMLI
jgi:hypothetical protein